MSVRLTTIEHMFDSSTTFQDESENPYGGAPTRSEEVAGGCGVAEIADLADVTEVLTKVDWTALEAEELGDVLREQAVITARLASVDLAIIDAFEKSAGGHLVHGRAVVGWLAAQTGVPRHEANRRFLAAMRLRHLPETSAALRRGDIHFAHAVAIGKTSAKPHLSWALEAGEKNDLVPAAKTMCWRDFRIVLRKFEETADPSQGEDEAKHQNDRAEFQFSNTFEGMFRADGWFDPVSGEIIDTELKRIYAVLLKADWAEARDRVGDDATSRDLCRTTGQRMKDALVEMAKRSSGARNPALPCVNVHVDHETFTQAVNEFAGLPAAYPAEGVRETNAGASLSARQIVELALAGHVRRIVFDSEGQILDFGQKKRFFTGDLREAIELRDRVCQHPGCELPGVWCQADHIEPFSYGGSTSIDNGQLLCGFHNRQKRDRYLSPWWDKSVGRLMWLTHPPI